MFFSLGSSYPRVYDVLHKSPVDNDNPMSNDVPLFSDETSEEDFVQERSWDSGEDHYFRWATNNRRPMESLVGRKRQSQDRPLRRAISDRPKNGIWASGLVG